LQLDSQIPLLVPNRIAARGCGRWAEVHDR